MMLTGSLSVIVPERKWFAGELGFGAMGDGKGRNARGGAIKKSFLKSQNFDERERRRVERVVSGLIIFGMSNRNVQFEKFRLNLNRITKTSC